jgi:hypothetical protein
MGEEENPAPQEKPEELKEHPLDPLSPDTARAFEKLDEKIEQAKQDSDD